MGLLHRLQRFQGRHANKYVFTTHHFFTTFPTTLCFSTTFSTTFFTTFFTTCYFSNNFFLTTFLFLTTFFNNIWDFSTTILNNILNNKKVVRNVVWTENGTGHWPLHRVYKRFRGQKLDFFQLSEPRYPNWLRKKSAPNRFPESAACARKVNNIGGTSCSKSWNII